MTVKELRRIFWIGIQGLFQILTPVEGHVYKLAAHIHLMSWAVLYFQKLSPLQSVTLQTSN